MTVQRLKISTPLMKTLLQNEKPLTQLHQNHKRLMAPLMKVLMQDMVLLVEETRQAMKVNKELHAKEEDKVDGLEEGNKPVVNGIEYQ